MDTKIKQILLSICRRLFCDYPVQSERKEHIDKNIHNTQKKKKVKVKHS